MTKSDLLTCLVALAVALIGYATLVIARVRLSAERPLVVFSTTRSDDGGLPMIELRNVGARPALDVELTVRSQSSVRASDWGALAIDDVARTVLPTGTEVVATVRFRDPAGGYVSIKRHVDVGDVVRLRRRSKPGCFRRLLDASLLFSPD